MSVFIAHAPADRETAADLEAFLERRGQFVELDDGQTALRPVMRGDVLVLLVSKDLVFAPMRLRLEQRALDAWAEGRLIVIKLDHGIAPVGLRDLPFIDASVAAQRQFKWQDVANAIREKLRPAPPSDAPAGAPPPPSRASGPDRKRRGPWGLIIGLLLMLPGLFALIASAAIWLVNRIGPTPGTVADLITGIDAFGARGGLSVGVTPTLFVVAIVVMLAAPVVLIARGGRRRRAAPDVQAEESADEDHESAAPPPGGSTAMFVSYSRANADDVLPVIEAATESGHTFWVDQQGISAGDSWAGEIVRAIRGAAGVLVMCSKAAFESDHVKREVYLADRYRRKLIPVYIEDAAPPEDFEYFFAGVQHLKLFETPEGERQQALAKLLDTPA